MSTDEVRMNFIWGQPHPHQITNCSAYWRDVLKVSDEKGRAWMSKMWGVTTSQDPDGYYITFDTYKNYDSFMRIWDNI